ncbi:MAG TPA: hypothetical protein VNW49_02645 [Puia sp.]|jgi:hypothetical protein|nr:hypothetical protein [Puia sp.]
MKYGKYMRIKGELKHSYGYFIIKRNDMEQEMEKLIWEYIDGLGDATLKADISKHIAEDPVWHNKYIELMNIHEMLQKEDLEMPSLRFTKNIMEEIAHLHVAPATKNYINKNVIRGFMAFFLVMIGGLFIYFIGQIHWSSNSTGNLIPAYSLNANKVNWSLLLNNTYVNIFIGINVMLGLILVDKYMQGKKNSRDAGRLTKGDSA